MPNDYLIVKWMVNKITFFSVIMADLEYVLIIRIRGEFNKLRKL